MAVPKKKTTKSKRNQRRSHDGLGRVNVVVDATTGEYKLPHHISLSDGYYNGRDVFAADESADEDTSKPEAAA